MSQTAKRRGGTAGTWPSRLSASPPAPYTLPAEAWSKPPSRLTSLRGWGGPSSPAPNTLPLQVRRAHALPFPPPQGCPFAGSVLRGPWPQLSAGRGAPVFPGYRVTPTPERPLLLTAELLKSCRVRLAPPALCPPLATSTSTVLRSAPPPGGPGDAAPPVWLLTPPPGPSEPRLLAAPHPRRPQGHGPSQPSCCPRPPLGDLSSP